VETGNPIVTEPAFSWGLFSPDIEVHVVGSAMVGTVRTTEIAFFAGAPGTPVWFRFFVDDHDLVRRADMTAPRTLHDANIQQLRRCAAHRAPKLGLTKPPAAT
jgi:hypothetical protein